MAAVGQNVPRKDGIGKATGKALYADDLTFPGMIHGRTIRSSIARGKVKSAKVTGQVPGLIVADYRDVPGQNVCYLIEKDQPFLVECDIRHQAEPILLLAHEDREILNAVHVDIEYEPQEPLFDPEKSDAVFKYIDIKKGDVERALARADLIVEGTYRTGHQEHVYIEPNGVIAVPENGGLAVYGSVQCPFYVIKALRSLLGDSMPIRVIQTETGGGFGGKEEYPSMIAGHACLLALKSGRPVKIIYDRVEDMIATTKRHPSIVTHRTGVMTDGRIVAMDVDVLLDGGAYVTLSPVVLSRGTIHAAGVYRCDNTRIQGRAVMTNTPPNGAFRGFGAPQTEFAVEVHMERIAEALKMDSVTLREMNALKPGDATAPGKTLRYDCSALMVLDEAVRRTDFRKKRDAWKLTNKAIGLALFYHGAGFTGSGERTLNSKARLDLTDTGVRIAGGSTEIGQGTRTMHAQIVADTLGLPYDCIDVNAADTAVVPDSGPTVASRTCMVVGRILQRCAEEMRAQLGRLTPAEYLKKHGPLVITKEYERPGEMSWDDKSYPGDAYGSYGWGCDVVELEIDRDTWEVRPISFLTVHEIGKAIHPMLATGQIEGGFHAFKLALAEALTMAETAFKRQGRTTGVSTGFTDLDKLLADQANGWALTRMPAVDRAVLRLGVFELLFSDEVDDAVAIDEAIELAKLLSTDDSPRFVNGVLGALAALPRSS